MYIRKVKKGRKIYSYYYKSKRIGNKVKSIYVGRALEGKIEKPELKKEKNINFDYNIISAHLLEFDNLLNEINKLIQDRDLNNSIHIYNKMFDIYKGLDINPDDKNKLFEKLNNVYSNLAELCRENKISI